MSQLSASQQKEELMKVHEKVKSLTGVDMNLFRPPYGDYNNLLVQTAKSCGYLPIQWDVDTLVTKRSVRWYDMLLQKDNNGYIRCCLFVLFFYNRIFHF